MKGRTFKRVIAFSMAVTLCGNIMTADTRGKLSVGFSIIVCSEENASAFGIDKKYLKEGNVLSVNNPDGYTLKYYVDDSEIIADPFVLSDKYYEKWITVKAYNGDTEVLEDRAYFSNLPVLYINTDDGEYITSKEEYKPGMMTVQSNDTSEVYEYNGKIEIKGRGNTSWKWPKKPYRVKLDKKADLFDMGENKNWVLIANYLDECFLRNKTAYDLSKELGLESMDSIWTDVILNGEYVGNYLLCEQIRIDKTRIDIFDWESEAKDIAKYIAKKNGLDKDSLEEQMKSDLSWVSTGVVWFNGSDYSIGKRYNDISGGYLFEMSDEYDEISKFTTANGLKIMLKSPEYLNTNQEMTGYAEEYWNNFEKAYRSEDGYVDTAEGKKHYTELADIDTMVSYWLVMDIMGNRDAVYKSRYTYKNSNSKLKFGPVWDFDWGCASLKVSSDARKWYLATRDHEQNIFREFLDDPLFIAKATEKYWEIRPYLETVIRSDGVLDSSASYLLRSGLADHKRWDRNTTWPGAARGFEKDAAVFIKFMRERIEWLDEQFSSDSKLLNSTYTVTSAAPYIRSDDIISFEMPNASSDTLTPRAPADVIIKPDKTLIADITVSDDETVSMDVYVNGIYYNSFSVSNNKTLIEVDADRLNALSGKKIVVSVICRNADGETTYKNFCTVIQSDLAEEIVPRFKTQALLSGEQTGITCYLDLSSLTAEEKALSYMEFKVNDKTVSDTFDNDCKDAADKYYGFTCCIPLGKTDDEITAVYHYGDEKTIEKTYLLAEYSTAQTTDQDKKEHNHRIPRNRNMLSHLQ